MRIEFQTVNRESLARTFMEYMAKIDIVVR